MKKSKTRIFINKKISSNLIVYIKEKQHHYLKSVLRVKINDQIMLFDNQTGEWISEIISIDRESITLKILLKNQDFIKEPDIWLAFSPIKQLRLNITVQKGTELGVSKFIPCRTNYTNYKSLNYRNLNLNIIEAAEQCERLTIPLLEKETSLDDLLKDHCKDRLLIFCNEKDKKSQPIYESIFNLRQKYNKWTILVGPEGGFSDEETNKIKHYSNSLSVSLGPRILRSDTAATAALFCLQSIIEGYNQSDNLS